MISSFVDILKSFVDKEAEMLKKQKIKHTGTIGDMFEDLTGELLEKLSVDIFKDLDLKVVSGFIEDNQGQLSGQIDCMLVVGEGKEVPRTKDFIYNINDVIAVIEVKKTLTKSILKDSIVHLEDVGAILPSKDHKLNLLKKSYESILKEPLPKFEEVKDVSDRSSLMYHILCVEAVTPVRIVMAYGGYKRESNFRNAFVDIIENKYKKSFSPLVIPSLVV